MEASGRPSVVIHPYLPLHEAFVHGVVDQLVGSFTPDARGAILSDAVRHQAVLARLGAATEGFIVWSESHAELEILWLGVALRTQRKGIGRALVRHVEQTATTQRVINVKAGLPEQGATALGLDPLALAGAVRFWVAVGYTCESRIANYWQQGNTAVVFVKRLWEREP